jgi:hypothetical protein
VDRKRAWRWQGRNEPTGRKPGPGQRVNATHLGGLAQPLRSRRVSQDLCLGVRLNSSVLPETIGDKGIVKSVLEGRRPADATFWLGSDPEDVAGQGS